MTKGSLPASEARERGQDEEDLAEEWHSHQGACLIHPAAGMATVETGEGHWVLPPLQAVWVPAGVRHRTSGAVATRMDSLLVDMAAFPNQPETLQVVGVTPLLRELLAHAVARPMARGTEGPEGRLVAVVLDQLRDLPLPALPLALPRDQRLRRLTEALIADPADNRSLADWGRRVGASSRTLARLFRAETGMSFRVWRQHLRTLEALRRLAQGQPVTQVALDVGYESSSAFVRAFRRHLGRSPTQYLSRTPS